jgi:hypothetical protein
MKKLSVFLTIIFLFLSCRVYAITAHVEFTSPPSGAETWVFAGVQDCGVVNGVMIDKTTCPYGKIAGEGINSVDITNIPPNSTVYATAIHVWRTTGETSGYASVVSSNSPALVLPVAPVDFPAPVIVSWPSGSMTITYGNK